ncbi:MAG: hypothetical protein ACK4JY_03850 [Brevundimonas sp.]|uniref:hypothetical protein n=1 Tax=Brevundimonas sp. TaxID=1871086 RepID=UPI00391AD033
MIAALWVATSMMFAPVYLECQMTTSLEGDTPAEAPWNWKITIHESEGRVDFTHSQGSHSVAAIFSADEVRFDGNVISRTDLTFTRNFDFIGENKVSRGRCRVVEAPRRAF